MGNTTTSTHKVIVTDGGTLKTVTNEAKGLNAELDKASKTSKTMSQAKEKSGPIMQSRMYDNARAGRGTGAEGRDFANQAQGLGGLVRVYATFAANLFAVSAAYNALSKAADTANMVKGLDQLGAASGRNLGTLAQNLVKATDNAVSLREAMQATAMASSSGMSNKDILRMAEGAKKASQALGVDMTDALSRISRGITKLEPELLDEIGIFVRVDTAARDYARSVGKPVTALTELERRAAFANATLTQVEKKFGDIQIDANPYNQLLATLKNLATEGLNVVNMFLGPLIKVLSESPTALAVAIAGIGGVLLKQALPAISQWREELELSADIAAKTAKETDDFYKEFSSGRLEQSSSKQAVALRNANTQIQTNIASLNQLGAISSRTNLGKAVSAYTDNASEANLEKVFEASEKRKQTIAKAIAKDIGDAKRQQYQEELAQIQQIEAASARMRSQQKIQAQAAAAYAQSTGSNGYFSQGQVLSRISQRAEAANTSARIVSVAAENSRFLGATDAFVQAMGSINKAVETNKISKLGGVMTAARSGVAILTGAITTLASGLMGLFGWIGLIISVGSVLLDFFRDNEKEANAASDALKTFDQSIDNVIRTTERLSKLSPVENMSLDAIQARSNALNDLAESAQTAIDKVNKEVLSRDTSEKITGGIAKFFGYGSENELADLLVKQVSASLELAGNAPKLQKSKQELLELTKTNGGESLKDKILSDKKFASTLGGKLANLAKEAKDINLVASDAASATTALTKARQDLANSFKTNDPMNNMAQTLISASTSLANALDSPIDNLSEILKLTREIASTGLLPDSAMYNIYSTTKSLEDLQAQYANVTQQSTKAKNALTSYQEANKYNVGNKTQELYGVEVKSLTGKSGTTVVDKSPSMEAYITSLDNSAEQIGKQIREKSDYLRTVATDTFKKAADLVSMKIQEGFTKAANTVTKAKYAGIAGDEAAIAKNFELKDKELAAQAQSISMLGQFTMAGYKATDMMIKMNADAVIAGTKNMDMRDMPPAVREMVYAANRDLQFLEMKGKINTVGDLNNAIKQNPLLEPQLRGMLGEVQAKQSIAVQLAQIKADRGAGAIEKERETREARTARDILVESREASLTTENAKAALELRKENKYILESEYLKELQIIEAQKLSNEYKAEEKRLSDAILNAKTTEDAKAIERFEADKTFAKKKFEDDQKRQKSSFDSKIGISKTSEETALKNSLDAAAETRANTAFENSQAQLDLDIQSLETAKSRNLVTEDDYNKRLASLQITQAEAKARKDIDTINSKFKKDSESLVKTINDTNSSPKVLEQANADLRAMEASRDGEIAAVNRSTEAVRVKNQALTEETQITKALRDTALDFASDFSDALFEATQTGKYDFKDMVDSMINDLARLILKIQMNNFAIQMMGGDVSKKSGGGGFDLMSLGKAAISWIAGPVAPAGGMPTGMSPEQMALAGYRNGGAFANGVEMFAKGGSFTNSIVNSPTLFKFAKGTGLMGEAGPEAIVPLRRDANGNLGVSSAGGSTQVVVNNYSSEKATTKESVDSRGNRRIEVEIGDMVAGEISRMGSNAQSSIKNTFGSKPQLIRR